VNAGKCQWRAKDLPELHTPVNSANLLENHRILVVVRQADQVYGTVDLTFQGLKQTDSHVYQQIHTSDLIGNNQMLG
jgi:hypothetical protein